MSCDNFISASIANKAICTIESTVLCLLLAWSN